MTNSIDGFPNHSEAKKYVEKLQQVKWPIYIENDNIDEFVTKVEKILFNDFKSIPAILKRFKPKEFPLKFFRVREVTDFNNINLFSEHSYPPSNFVGLNRCNLPKNPVFYCSENPLTALSEVIRNGNHKERIFCLSSWELLDIDEEFVFETFLHSDINVENMFSSLKETELEFLNKPFGKSEKDGIAELLKFLHNSFINDKTYSLSASLAHRTLNAKRPLATDILMYPSVQTKYKGVNMAIHPNFVDNRMAVQRFYIIELKNYNIETGKFEVNFSKYGDLNKNRINWKNIDPADETYKKHILKDFNHIMENGFSEKFTKIKK